MSCCGERRAQQRIGYSNGRSESRRTESLRPADGRVVFEYTGPDNNAVVKGAVTGRGYGFAGYGARVAVDARDEESLSKTVYLQRVLR